MAMVYTYQVADYFRKLIDESDSTFVADSLVSSFLEIGENQYRQAVADVMPEFYIVTQDYTISNATSINLGGATDPIVGSTVAAPERRLSQLVRVVILDNNSLPKNILSAAPSYEAMITPSMGPVRYLLQNERLKFSSAVTGIVRLEYIPVSDTDWTALASNTTEWIDDLVNFHDLIALFAAGNYAIADNAVSQALQLQLQRRLKDLESFVTRGRDISANRYVAAEDPYGRNS